MIAPQPCAIRAWRVWASAHGPFLAAQELRKWGGGEGTPRIHGIKTGNIAKQRNITLSHSETHDVKNMIVSV